jgi:hypothetical protein
MTFYADMAIFTDELLNEFGQSVTVTLKSAGTYNPSAGTTTVTTVTQTGTAVILPYAEKFVDGTLIKLGDQQLLLSPVDISEPKVGDTVTVGTIVYTITNVKAYKPAGTLVLYDLNIRGA